MLLSDSLSPGSNFQKSREALETEFIAFISHEILTPLASIIGYSDLMYDANQSTREKFDCISKVRRNAREIEGFLQNLIHLSQLDLGGLSIHAKRFDFGIEILETLNALKGACFKKELRFRCKPETFPPFSLMSDPVRLREIILNVTLAIIETTDSGMVTVETDLQSHNTESGMFSITVSSASNRLQVDEVNHIFSAEKGRRYYGSYLRGRFILGLYLSQRLAKALGGEIIAEKNKSSVGTQLRIQISRGPVFEVDPGNQLEKKDTLSNLEGDVGLPHLKGCEVLVIEDDDDVRALIEHYLKRTQANVTCVSNGREGIEKAKEKKRHVVLMDVEMPVLDGIQSTRELRRNGYGGAVIALTAHAMSCVKEDCLAAGCDAYLTKPFDAHTLLSLILHFYRKQQSG